MPALLRASRPFATPGGPAIAVERGAGQNENLLLPLHSRLAFPHTDAKTWLAVGTPGVLCDGGTRRTAVPASRRAGRAGGSDCQWLTASGDGCKPLGNPSGGRAPSISFVASEAVTPVADRGVAARQKDPASFSRPS